MVALAASAPMLLGILGLAGNDSLVWTATPLRWPTFEPLVALSLLPLLAPLLRLPAPAARRATVELLPEPVSVT
jgi:hypothetical protein